MDKGWFIIKKVKLLKINKIKIIVCKIFRK
jgi:hypothetical protein